MEFDKYWLLPMGVLPIGLIAILVFLVSSISCVVSVIKKKLAPKALIPICVFPILVVILFKAPLPTYVDGMYQSVSSSLSLGELEGFAADARASNPDWNNYEKHDQIVQNLRKTHAKALGLSPISPRIQVSEQYVSVFYGSALVKHWGYVVGDLEQFPIEHIPEHMHKKVYEGVWVYHDIW